MAEQIDRETFLREWEKMKELAGQFLEKRPRILESLGLSGKDAGPAYQSAYNAFAAEDYEVAQAMFTVLFLMDMREKAFQTGLAASLEAQEKFEGALAFYALAMSQDDRDEPEDPGLMFRAGKCLLASGRREEAMILFDMAAQAAPADAKGVRAIERSKKMLAVLAPG